MRMLANMTRQKMRPEFNHLHAVTLDRTATTEDLTAALRAADAFADRRRLSEGAVYTSACRRYLLTTGTDWKETQQAATATAWGGQSDHRSRIDGTPAYGYGWRCSCGVQSETLYPTNDAATDGHAAHRRTAAAA